MLRTTLLSLILLVSLSSTSILRKSISRRQAEPEYCQAIEGFECKCSHYRVTCTTDRDLPQSLNVLPNERQKYPSVELIINGERDQTVYEYTLEPVKQLFKPDADNLEFRIKFEKFTALHLSSPGIFNRVFPDNLPSTARTHIALEIYNPQVQPDDNVNLFANLNVDSLELYVLYPFRGSFQQLFTGANIKYLRLSGGDIRSDLSQPFTGNIGRLELAKQAAQLTVQNFPAYPAHEYIINAFYVTDFNSDNPPNYSNLDEIRIFSQERIPANAFRNYPNIHTLSVSTEKDIDSHAFDGLNHLEKLTIKDTKPSLEVLNNLYTIKEFEASIEKLDDREQCQLVEKLANGQVAVLAIPSGRECTCASAYLDSASGRYPCDAQSCDQSSCAAIKNNYDASTRTFKAPPAIKRADGTDALRQREPKVYTVPFQLTSQDKAKVQQGAPQQASEQEGAGQQQSDGVTEAGPAKKSRRTKPRTQVTTPSYDQQQNPGEPGQWQPEHNHENQSPWNPQYSNNIPETEKEYFLAVGQNKSPQTDSTSIEEEDYERSEVPSDYPNDYESDTETTTKTLFGWSDHDAQQGETNQDDGNENQQGDGNENRQEGEGTENRQEGEGGHAHHSPSDPNQSTEAGAIDGTDNPAPPAKKGLGWLPIIIIIAAVGGLLLIGLIILILRKRRTQAYNAAPTSEQGTTQAARS